MRVAQFHAYQLLFSCLHTLAGGGGHLAVGVDDFYESREAPLPRRFVEGADVDGDVGRTVGDAVGAPADTPKVEASLGGRHEPYIAVYAGTGIPARVGLARMIYAHCKRVGLSCRTQPGGHVVSERHIAVWPAAQQVAVEINLTAVVNTLEIDEMTRGAVVGCEESLSIPPDSSGVIAGATVERRRRQHLDAPVVRERKLPPRGVRIFRKRHRRRISGHEAPAIVEADGVPERSVA